MSAKIGTEVIGGRQVVGLDMKLGKDTYKVRSDNSVSTGAFADTISRLFNIPPSSGTTSVNVTVVSDGQEVDRVADFNPKSKLLRLRSADLKEGELVSYQIVNNKVKIFKETSTRLASTPLPTASPTVQTAPLEQPSAHVPEAHIPAPAPEVVSSAARNVREAQKIDLSTVDFISQPEAKHVPEMLVDFYNFDQFLEKPEKPTVLMVGPPGVGKSVSTYTAAREIAKGLGYDVDKEFVEYSDKEAGEILTALAKGERRFVFHDLRLTELEPQDLIGRPRSDQMKVMTAQGETVIDVMRYDPPLWAVVLSQTPGVLFLDEITNVQRDDMKAAAYKIALDKRVGFTKFHPETMVVAAGNPEGGIAVALPPPLVNRCLKMEVKTPTIANWIDWMDKTYKDAWDRRVVAYLMSPAAGYDRTSGVADDFLKVPEDETLENFPTPRSWTKVAVMLPQIRPEYGEVLLKGYLGEAVANKFLSFIKLKPPSVEELMQNPKKWTELEELDVKWLVLLGVSNKYRDATEKHDLETIRKLLPLIDVIGDDSAEFLAGMVVMMKKENLLKSVVNAYKIDKATGEKISDVFGKYGEITKLFREVVKG